MAKTVAISTKKTDQELGELNEATNNGKQWSTMTVDKVENEQTALCHVDRGQLECEGCTRVSQKLISPSFQENGRI